MHSCPKRLRYFLSRDAEPLNAALHIFLRAVDARLRECSRSSTGRIGAVRFVHRFGAALNAHVHFHCRLIDGVFVAGEDGELRFAGHPIFPDMAARLEEAKRTLGLRVQGVLIGDRETVGFLEIADHIFPLRDWRKYGGDATDFPVHSHRLTAMYFPGALRSRENLDATVSPAEAAAAVRRGKT